MAKRRFQDPEPEVVGNWWQIRVYRDDTKGKEVRKRTRISWPRRPCRYARYRDQSGVFETSIKTHLSGVSHTV